MTAPNTGIKHRQDCFGDAVEAITPERLKQHEAKLQELERTRPRQFDLTDPAECRRLLRETLGYARVSLNKKEGTDLRGRQFAHDALERAICFGFVLTLPPPPNAAEAQEDRT